MLCLRLQISSKWTSIKADVKDFHYTLRVPSTDCFKSIESHKNAYFYRIIFSLGHSSHPVSVRRWGLLDSPGKMSNFQKFYGVRPRGKVSTGEIRKPIWETTKSTGDDIKIQRGELTKIVHWVKDIYTWFTQKQKNGWVTFKCEKIFKKIALAIKSSLKVH